MNTTIQSGRSNSEEKGRICNSHDGKERSHAFLCVIQSVFGTEKKQSPMRKRR
jgi:hypothetical protein